MCNGDCLRSRIHANGEGAPDRRDFLTQSLLTAVAGLLATGTVGCGLDLLSGTGPSLSGGLSSALTIKLADFPALAAVGGIARVDGGTGTPIAVAHTATSTYVAVSMICTHQGTTINITGNGFTCPNHGAMFAADGQWTGGQPTTSLVTYPVSYDATAGTLQIGGTTVPVVTLTLQPASLTLAIKQTMQLTATPADAAGATVPGVQLSWSSANTTVATVTNGLVTAVAAGTTTITATCNGVTATATVTVSAASATGLVINPTSFSALSVVGGIARVDNQQPGSTPIAVVRTGTNSWAAFSMICPHQGTTINIVSGGFLCPNHGARFNTSGANIGGQTSGPLTTLPVTVQPDGTLLIDSSSVPATGGGSGGGSDDSHDD